MNCLRAAGLTHGYEQLTAVQLLRVPNMGKKSLKDLALCVERFLIDCCAGATPAESVDSGVDSSENYRLDHDDREPPSNAAWLQIEHILKPIFAVVAEIGDAHSLSDVLNPRFILTASHLGRKDELDGIRLSDAADGQLGLAGRMADRLRSVLDGLSERDGQVLAGRLSERPPATLEEIGSKLGITRERVRQIQVRLQRKVMQALGEEPQQLARILAENLRPLVPQDAMEKYIANALPDMPDRERMIIRYHLIEAMGYALDSNMFVSLDVKAGIGEVRELVERMADEAGIVDEEQFRAALHDDSPALAEHWDWLRQRCNLYQFHGFVALRNSAKARVMAALRAIGQPATKHEIGKLCRFTDTQVGGALSNLNGVARADAERWGLKEWIDDEYDGIVGEIIQRIKEDRGVTTTERLLSEIPGKFGVSPASVDAYMKTPRFHLQDGTIRLADPSRVLLRPFHDVIHGRDESGYPFWTFRAEERHFRGYSALGVPPEFIKALGCEPDGRIMIRCAREGLNKAAFFAWLAVDFVF